MNNLFEVKNIALLTFAIIATALLYPKVTANIKSNSPSTYQKFNPRPTNGTLLEKKLKDSKLKSKKDAWFELLHNSKASTDWRKVEQKNQWKQFQNNQNTDFRGGQISVAGGIIRGYWTEKGSNNQAGSVRKTAYSKRQDKIYALSDGGSIWKGSRDGTQWQLVNDKLRFEKTVLEIIDFANFTRIFVEKDGRLLYSDDEGINWNKPSGFGVSYSEIKDVIFLENNEIFVLSKNLFDDDIQLKRSTNLGLDFSAVFSYPTSVFDQLSMNVSSDHKEVYIIHQPSQNKANIYWWNDSSSSLVKVGENSNIDLFSSTANIFLGPSVNGTPLLYRWDDSKFNNFATLYRSTNLGAAWQSLESFSDFPMAAGFYVSRNNFNNVFMGGINCHKSINGGLEFTPINYDYEYFNNPTSNLHADIMDIDEFTDINNENFMLISTHGGIYISYNSGETVKNITERGLNITQYYDVVSLPSDPKWIFAGSQDQGLQRAENKYQEDLSFMQLYGGDYGHLSFTNNGNELWVSYPGGWITYYDDPMKQSVEPTTALQINSGQESVWIPPVYPIPNQKAVLVAGGNVNGGSGSFLIKITANNSNQFTTQQFDFNFGVSGGEISAIAINHFDNDVWYVATTNGRFYRSMNAGTSWESMSLVGPQADLQYLYGSCIYPSKINKDVVYFAGSGYDTDAIYKSVDGGTLFNSLVNELPKTTVFEIAANEDESLLFAATEAGPYIYVKETDTWYSLLQGNAPNQTYWSVEVIQDGLNEVARFGTFGRGIWDFKISNLVNTEENDPQPISFDIYPNPVKEKLSLITTNFDDIEHISIYSMNGSFIFEAANSQIKHGQIPVSELKTGNYMLQVRMNGQYFVKKFVKI